MSIVSCNLIYSMYITEFYGIKCARVFSRCFHIELCSTPTLLDSGAGCRAAQSHDLNVDVRSLDTARITVVLPPSSVQLACAWRSFKCGLNPAILFSFSLRPFHSAVDDNKMKCESGSQSIDTNDAQT